jgi:hypothetical protein
MLFLLLQLSALLQPFEATPPAVYCDILIIMLVTGVTHGAG